MKYHCFRAVTTNRPISNSCTAALYARSALYVVRITKRFKSYILILVCLGGLTALVSAKMIEMANQSMGLLFTQCH